MSDIQKEKDAQNPFADAMEQLKIEDPPEVQPRTTTQVSTTNGIRIPDVWTISRTGKILSFEPSSGLASNLSMTAPS